MVTLAAAALCLAVAVPSRSATRRATGCRSAAAHVRSFSGKASDTFDGTASAADAGQGGTETVELVRQANLQFTLKYIGGAIVKQRDYVGGQTGGSIGVDDSYNHTGTGSQGSLQGSPAVGAAAATLVLYPKVCRYQFEMAFLGEGTSTGPLAPQDVPLSQYGGSAYTPQEPIPASLHLIGSASILAYVTGCSDGSPADPYNPPDELGCYEFSGGWSPDYAILEQCHAPFGGTCAPKDAPEGSANITWNLKPGGTTKKKGP